MIGNTIILNFISLILYTRITPVHSQGYLSPKVLENGNFSDNIDLVWNFTTESYVVNRIRFFDPQSEIMMIALPGSPPIPGTGFGDKVEYKYPFGITIFNLTFMDSGTYTCEILLNNSQLYPNDTKLNVYKFDGDLQHNIFFTTVEGKPIHGEVITDQVFDAVINVPENMPPAISVKMDAYPISLGYIERFNVSSENVTLRIDAPFNSVINITSLMEHPLFESGVLTMATVRVEEIDPQEDKCKWWCILIIVLVVVSVVVIIIIICCCWHYKVACFAHKSSAQIDVNQKQETNGFGMENKAY